MPPQALTPARPDLAPFGVLILALDAEVLGRSFLPPPAPGASPGAGAITLLNPMEAGLPAPAAAPEAITPRAIAPQMIVPQVIVPQVMAPGAITPRAVAPGAIVPVAPVGAITPAKFAVPWGVETRVLAQKKPDKDAKLFRLEPDHTGAAARVPQRPEGAPAPNPVPFMTAPVVSSPTGAAQMAALTLRRALLNTGFPDVMSVGPDSTAISRVVGERRLTPRVLEALRLTLRQLQENPTGKPDLRAGVLAAARVGQAVGYRTVIVLAVAPSGTPAPGAPAQGGAGAAMEQAGFSLLLVDALREVGEPLLYDEKGVDLASLREAAASTGAALIEKSVRSWPVGSGTADRAQLARRHYMTAQAALEAGSMEEAQDFLNQSITLDSTRGEAYILLGDVLQKLDPAGAAVAYRRAVELNARDASTWAKIATGSTTSTPPDWPRALDAARRALALGHDTVTLRVAMATAQFGRADLFRKADRLEKAEDAEFEARQHLDKALEQGPEDPNVVRLLTRQLIAQRQYEVAVQTLDRVAPRYPRDIEIQTQYANALSRMEGREEDAFITSSRVWKLSGQRAVDVDIVVYRRLAEGFDRRLFNLGKSASQLTTGVANAALPREAALLQLTRLVEDMEAASVAINVLRPPVGVTADVAGARTFAADLMNQALEKHQAYLETGQEIFRVRALELYRQAVGQLNIARSAK